MQPASKSEAAHANYANPNHHLPQRQVNEFYMAILKKLTDRVCEHTLETHGLSLHRLQT